MGAKKTISYRYDAVGNRVGMTDPDGGRFTYAWDAVNRISHLVNPQGDRTTYAYDPGGRRTVKKLANGTRASFSYDNAGNLTKLANLKSDGSVISSFDYQYDKTGNRKAVLEADGSRVTWSYDDTYQLTGEHRTGSHPYRNTFVYDRASNRTLKNEDGARTTYSYDSANQLETAGDAAGTTTYTFDADGNQELVQEPSGDRTTTTWDYENRTTLVQLPSGIRNTMAYEPDGLRVKLEESTGTKKFVWDERIYLAELDTSDNIQVLYTSEPRLYARFVSQTRTPETRWYHYNGVGCTTELSSLSASISDTILYDAWGRVISETGPATLRLAYGGSIGYYFYADASHIYVKSRFYNPSLARWQSVDAAGFVDGNNRYAYVSNHPLVFVDPTGHCFVTVNLPDHQPKDAPWSDVTLPAGELGRTPFDVDTDCSCIETQCPDRCFIRPGFEICCSIDLSYHIVIDVTQAEEAREPISGIYGHEQQHVKNLRCHGLEGAKRFDKYEELQTCYTVDVAPGRYVSPGEYDRLLPRVGARCRNDALELQFEMWQTLLAVFAREASHVWTAAQAEPCEGSPRSGVPQDPINGLPDATPLPPGVADWLPGDIVPR